jgi:hypothetical protein
MLTAKKHRHDLNSHDGIRENRVVQYFTYRHLVRKIRTLAQRSTATDGDRKLFYFQRVTSQNITVSAAIGGEKIRGLSP